MSDVTGADLEQLDTLAGAYQQRGAEIAARAADLDHRVVATVATFQTALADLRTRATSANEVLVDDVDALAQTAASTTWTGANREAFDGDLALLRQGITSTTGALTTRLDQLEHEGVSPFAEVLTAFGRQATGAGDAAERAGLSMRSRVAEQRASLAEAADMGWSAV